MPSPCKSPFENFSNGEGCCTPSLLTAGIKNILTFCSLNVLRVFDRRAVYYSESTFNQVVMNMTDQELLVLLRSDREKGLQAVMSAYSRLVYSIVSGILTSEEDRGEAVNDTFYKVWRLREEIDLSRAGLKGYVSMVARTCALDKLKRLKVYEPLSDNEADLGIDVDFEDDRSAKANERIIAECISAMPSPDREIFISRFYFEKPISEIAREVGLSVRRVEYILEKDKRRLRRALIKGGILL